ncbi:MULTISPECIES: FusB/FusC family EF-G-binding protein [unclassified Paenibacillus]|uniref:FusB/FusC family EF-G-binding protein n=1 Tax=unclassified Paenibacillus TaxID=185978 RepID=UPI00070C48BE|nr:MULTISPECIES: FusB/FusC family EF-G-binding protein [unclassified Paenibacillus]KQX48969.1 fibronectin-binding protein [Paenibacillus sp. Root444D2]KRE36587.1 fibronectin-binding protein [Paenibacillus sp. Soil724D2]
MNQPFIRNHQYNDIKKQVGLLQSTCNSVSDRKVVESVRYNAQAKLNEVFPDANELQKQALGNITLLQTAEEFQRYLRSLEPYLAEFAHVTENQLKKLFPKIKKLKVPDLTAIDYRYVTYLGWIDIATNKLFLVYHLNGKLVGIEGKYTPTNKKGVCFVCNRHEEVALFTAVTKWKPASATPDYYRAIGNYLCVNSEACNKNITDVAVLEKFIQDVLVGP